MIKRILIFIITLLVVFFTVYSLNKSYLQDNNVTVAFSLLHIYIFQIITTFIVYITVEILLKKLSHQAGYLFLGLNTLQIGLFLFVFKKYIFAEDPLSTAEKLCFFIPLFLGIFTELIAVVKLLNKQEYSKKKLNSKRV